MTYEEFIRTEIEPLQRQIIENRAKEANWTKYIAAEMATYIQQAREEYQRKIMRIEMELNQKIQFGKKEYREERMRLSNLIDLKKHEFKADDNDEKGGEI